MSLPNVIFVEWVYVWWVLIFELLDGSYLVMEVGLSFQWIVQSWYQSKCRLYYSGIWIYNWLKFYRLSYNKIRKDWHILSYTVIYSMAMMLSFLLWNMIIMDLYMSGHLFFLKLEVHLVVSYHIIFQGVATGVLSSGTEEYDLGSWFIYIYWYGYWN